MLLVDDRRHDHHDNVDQIDDDETFLDEKIRAENHQVAFCNINIAGPDASKKRGKKRIFEEH